MENFSPGQAWAWALAEGRWVEATGSSPCCSAAGCRLPAGGQGACRAGASLLPVPLGPALHGGTSSLPPASLVPRLVTGQFFPRLI